MNLVTDYIWSCGDVSGIASGTEDGVVKNEVMLDYAGLRLIDGKWHSGGTVYVGSRLEDESGKVSLLVKGVRSDGQPEDVQYDVVLDPKSKPAADKLAKMLPNGTVFNLYDYGVGDHVTIPCVMSLRANADGTYALTATDDVTVTLPGKQTLVRAAGSEKWQPVVDSLITLSISKGNAEIRIEK